ncbi:18S rRNA maturation protein [Dipsacomyces acuminosporus]|nr:18S rRNA maturation protein [Dipsacomyces acuminosporus]
MPKHQRPSSKEGSSQERKPYAKGAGSSKGRKKTSRTMDTQLPTNLSGCKKLLRDTNRLLNRPKLNSSKKVELERRVKMLTVLMQQMTSTQQVKKNATKYHGIKFFERKKVLKKLKQLEANGDKGGDNGEKLDLLVDLNYTTYYPDEHKYISLYPNDPSKTPKETKEKQEKIRLYIRKAMERGDLPKDPRAVKAEDRKAIRKANKALLRSISIADGLDVAEDDSGSDDENDGSADSDGSEEDEANGDTGDIEQDEFFASD